MRRFPICLSSILVLSRVAGRVCYLLEDTPSNGTKGTNYAQKKKDLNSSMSHMLSEYPEPQRNHQKNPTDWSQEFSSKTLDPSYKNSSFQKAPCLLLSSLWIIHKFFDLKKQMLTVSRIYSQKSLYSYKLLINPQNRNFPSSKVTDFRHYCGYIDIYVCIYIYISFK